MYKLLAHRARDIDDVDAIVLTQARTQRRIDWAHVERWAAYWSISDRVSALRERLGH